MEEAYCYKCEQIQKVDKEHPRYDWDDHGKVKITDITCCKCKRRFRLYKRVEANHMAYESGQLYNM